MRRVGRARSLRGTVTSAMIAALLVACGDTVDEAASTTAPATTAGSDDAASTTSLPSEAAVANADGQVTTALGTFPLRASTCDPDAGESVAVVAETEDGAGRLEIHGRADGATLVFTLDKGDGDPVAWHVAEAKLTVVDDDVTHEGPSIVSGQVMSDTMISVSIIC